MTSQNEHHDDPQLPKPLADDLAGLYEPPGEIPSDIDENIIYSAKQQFGDTRRSFRWGGIGVVAATITLVFLIQHVLQPRRPAPQLETRVPAIAIREDIDLSGRVDILDAFKLARHLETGGPPQSAWDVNRDGAVDQADVDAVAMAAVQITGGAS